MAFHLRLTLNRKTVTVSGVGALILLIGLLCLPQLLAPTLSPQRAEVEIRRFLKWQAAQSQMAELKAAGLSVPDESMASRWKADLDRIEQVEFETLKIKRSLLASPLSSSRLFVVKVTFRDVEPTARARYFSLSADSKLFDFFWTLERPRWVWLLAV